MRLFTAIISALILSMASSLMAQHVSVQMPNDHGYVGVPMQFIVVFENIDPDVEPTIPELKGFSIRKLPNKQTSSQTIIRNGKVTSTSTVAVTFLLTPEETGELTIPPLTFRAGGKAFQSQSKTIQVTEPPTGGSLKVTVTGTQKDVYLGQPIDLKLNIFVEQFTDNELGVTLEPRDMFSFIRGDSSLGVFADALANGRVQVFEQRGENDAGKEVTFLVFQASATTWPETIGSVELQPIHILMDYPIALERTRGFGFFGGDTLQISQSQLISATSQMPAIEVLSPPSEGQPLWYSGAVGSFDFRVVVDKTYVNVGEPITLTMRVSDLTQGPVNLDYLSAPDISEVEALTQHFRVASEKPAGKVEARTKTFTQTIRPKRHGQLEIPALPFSSFNPKTNSYETAWTMPIPIHVNETATISAEDLDGYTPDNDYAENGKQFTEVEGGILANYSGPSLLVSDRVFSIRSVVVLLSIPPALFLIMCGFRFFVEKQSSPKAKQRSLTKQVKKRVANIQSLPIPEQASELSKSLRLLQHHWDDYEGHKTDIDTLVNRCDESHYGSNPDEALVREVQQFVGALS